MTFSFSCGAEREIIPSGGTVTDARRRLERRDRRWLAGKAFDFYQCGLRDRALGRLRSALVQGQHVRVAVLVQAADLRRIYEVELGAGRQLDDAVPEGGVVEGDRGWRGPFRRAETAVPGAETAEGARGGGGLRTEVPSTGPLCGLCSLDAAKREEILRALDRGPTYVI
jgi:hypothetical protein